MVHFVRTRLGIILQDHQLDNLRRAVADGCQRFGHLAPEVLLLALHNGASAELEYLIARITVGESYFFRDQEQVSYLRECWLPDLIARKRASGCKSIRILSAGCSSGQEIYTLAILLQEALPDIDEWALHLLGTDINAESLSEAVLGRYTEWSLRATPEEIRHKYFVCKEREYTINPALRDKVRFSYLNLLTDAFPSVLSETNALDLILCRNVFIYFDPPIIKDVLRKFAACLVPEGTLMLGASDLVDYQETGLRLNQHGSVFYYTHAQHAVSGKKHAGRAARPIVPARASSPAPTPRHQHPPRKESTAVTGEAGIPQQILAAAQQGRWPDACRLIEKSLGQNSGHSGLWQHKAKLLANLGHMELAEEACKRSLDLEPTDKHGHFLHAMILAEQNRAEDAEKALRKSIFLDSGFVEAYFQLGMLLLRNGRREHGIKSLRNALAICERGQPGQVLESDPDFTLGRLAEILRNDLSIYEAKPA